MQPRRLPPCAGHDPGAPASTCDRAPEEVALRPPVRRIASEEARSSARQAACGAQGQLEPERPRHTYRWRAASRRVAATLADHAGPHQLRLDGGGGSGERTCARSPIASARMSTSTWLGAALVEKGHRLRTGHIACFDALVAEPRVFNQCPNWTVQMTAAADASP